MDPGNIKLLFFHGLTSAPAEVQTLKERLAGVGVEMSVPLLAGHGTSVEDLAKISHSVWLCDAEQRLSNTDTEHEGVWVGGLSFGALLALYLGMLRPERVKGLILLSPPLIFRDRFKENLLSTIAMLPDSFLNILPCVNKSRRGEKEFLFKRSAYEKHSLAAVVRLLKIKDKLRTMTLSSKIPIFAGFALDDHLLCSKDLLNKFQLFFDRSPDVVKSYPEASHELLIGRRYSEVCDDVISFILGGKSAS